MVAQVTDRGVYDMKGKMTRPTKSMVRDLAQDALDSISESEIDNEQALVTVRGDQLIDVLEDYIQMRDEDDALWWVA